jgi:hypothetical protein
MAEEKKEESFEELQAKLRAICPHINERVMRESQWTGRVVCLDCGREREWNAY